MKDLWDLNKVSCIHIEVQSYSAELTDFRNMLYYVGPLSHTTPCSETWP